MRGVRGVCGGLSRTAESDQSMSESTYARSSESGTTVSTNSRAEAMEVPVRSAHERSSCVVACAWCKKKFCASCRSFSFVGYAYASPGDFICYKCHPHDCSPPCRPKRSRSTFHGPIPKALRDFNGAGVKDDTAADKAALTRKRERAPTRRFAEYLIADH